MNLTTKQRYLEYGVDVDAVLKRMTSIPISLHCWQGDDVSGFDQKGPLSGGIQATGNYPGKARTLKELMLDIDQAFHLIPGQHKLNLHASYASFKEDEWVDRDQLEPKHFQAWIDFARERKIGLDFNPTFFSHPMVVDGLTLSSPLEPVRKFWIEHAKRCLNISEAFAKATGQVCVMNIWIPDGYKNIPSDRFGPRQRFKASLDEILAYPYDKNLVYVTLESKVFGIGLESYTVGSAEFCMSYVSENGITPLMDNGHYHPTELVSDKVSSLLLFNKKIALHITRGVRWDSDHVVLLDDETKEIALEIVRNNALDRVFIATDFFDASINRIAAWVIGTRSVQKALLIALLQPHDRLKQLQDESRFTELMILQEELKTLPWMEVWEAYLESVHVPRNIWTAIDAYEKESLSLRK